MTIVVHDVTHDEVIRSTFALARTDYNFAIQNLVPLLGRFDEQRKTQNAKFYARLREDIIKGCVMPPLTIAFVSKDHAELNSAENVQDYVTQNISQGYILDGMQRLNTLNSASDEDNFPGTRSVYLNILIAERHDLLLYRMITLNNGQRPMTPRHQVEILTQKLLDFENLNNIKIQKEKDTEDELIRGAFRLGDIAAAYTAFLANNVNNENNKIIDEKMNEILVGRVMDSDIGSVEIQFADVVEYVDNVCSDETAKRWLRVPNNLIGFTVGARAALNKIHDINAESFGQQVTKFDAAFDIIKPSKVNVGRFRRELSRAFFENIDVYSQLDLDAVSEKFVDLTTTD